MDSCAEGIQYLLVVRQAKEGLSFSREAPQVSKRSVWQMARRQTAMYVLQDTGHRSVMPWLCAACAPEPDAAYLWEMSRRASACLGTAQLRHEYG